MTDTTWESVFQKTFSNDSRDFSLGTEDNETVTYSLCSAMCAMEVDKWDFKDYIRGMTVSGSDSVIRIDPTVDTTIPPGDLKEKALSAVTGRPGKTVKRKKLFQLSHNGDFNNPNPDLALYTGGLNREYYLQDIFIQAPSKFSVAKSRYPMEVGMVFRSKSGSRSIVTVTPVMVSQGDEEPEDLTEKGLHKTMMSLAGAIPRKGRNNAVPGVEMWTPRMFLPREDKRKFVRWTDGNDPTVNYIVFYSPESALTFPRTFYNNFASRLSGGAPALVKATSAPPRKMPGNTYIELNENISPQPIDIRYKMVPEIIPEVQATVHQFMKQKKKDDEKDDKECPEPDCPKDDSSKKGWFSRWGKYVLIGIVIVIVLGFLIHWWTKRGKSGGDKAPVNTSVEMGAIGNSSGSSVSPRNVPVPSQPTVQVESSISPANQQTS